MFAFISLVHIPNLLIRQTIIALTSHTRGLCRTFSASCHEIASPCAEHSPPPLPSSVLIQPEVFGRWDNAERVGVAHSSSPALDTDHRVALVKDTKLDGIHDSPLQTAVDIFLPWGGVEVRLLLGEIEWIYATIQMGVLPELAKKLNNGDFEAYTGGHGITGNHDDWADGAILGDQTSGSTTDIR